jgi:hypothetical protein
MSGIAYLFRMALPAQMAQQGLGQIGGIFDHKQSHAFGLTVGGWDDEKILRPRQL